jgi:hypothetical protein
MAVACAWLLGATAMVRPWDGPLVWGGVAVGCAVVRMVALWVLRDVPGDRPAGADPSTWVRSGALWLLVGFATATSFAAWVAAPDVGGNLDSLRRAGAEVYTGIVVERPRTRVERDKQGEVEWYVSRLVLSVEDGERRVVVRGAYTHDKPYEETRVEVMWAPSDPGLGGHVDDRTDLPALAAGRWAPFLDGEAGDASLIAFGVFGGLWVIMLLSYSDEFDADAARRMAWSAPAQTVRTLVMGAVYAGWRPFLLGHEPAPVETFLVAGSLALVPLAYVVTTLFWSDRARLRSG